MLAGNTYDFGTIVLGPSFGIDKSALVMGNPNYAFQFENGPLQWTTDPTRPLEYFGDWTSVSRTGDYDPTVVTGNLLPSSTYNLIFSAGSDTQIEFAWIGSTNYTPAVPEPSTWAMMILGFAGLGWKVYRSRLRSPNNYAYLN
jgi:hypothetical protein